MFLIISEIYLFLFRTHVNNEDKIGAFQFQQLESFETKLTEKIFDLPILNVQGGTYPSSKINCVIGQVMLSVWGTITFCHI